MDQTAKNDTGTPAAPPPPPDSGRDPLGYGGDDGRPLNVWWMMAEAVVGIALAFALGHALRKGFRALQDHYDPPPPFS